MFKRQTHLKWIMIVVTVSVFSIILNVSQNIYAATVDAQIPRKEKEKIIHFNARNMYNHYCVHCHGQEGKGDGRSFAYELEPKPRDFTDAEYMSSLKDEDISKVIKEGSTSVGKSNLCPAWGETFSKNEVKGLVAYVRSFSPATPAAEGGEEEMEEPGEEAETAPEEAPGEGVGVKPFIVWPILTLVSAFFICMAIFQWRKK